MVTIVKVKRDLSGGNVYLENVVKYINNPARALALGGNGVNPFLIDDTFEQMMRVKRYYDKTSGNPLVHLIVSYDKSLTDVGTACRYTKMIAEYYEDRFQMLWCTHLRDDNKKNLYTDMGDDGEPGLHAHILANSVSYRDGKMFNSSPEYMQGFCDHVEGITGIRARLYYEKLKKQKQ